MLCGTAFKNKGVQPLLDAVVDFLPSPLDVPPVKGVNPNTGEEIERLAPATTQPFSALAFKIMTDPFVGTLTFFRVYSGVLESGAYVFNSTKGKKERIGRLLKMHANKREEIKEVYAGDIAAAVGLRDTTTGDTLCDETKPIILESIEFPEPVISIAIEPKTKADQEKLGVSLQKLATEDPSFRVATDHETGQTHHLRDGRAAPRDHRRPPAARVQGRRQRRQAAGRVQGDDPQDGRAGDQVRPPDGWPRPVRSRRAARRAAAAREGLRVRRRHEGRRRFPREYIPAVEKGIREAIEGGVLAGYPVVDVKVTLTDGSYHEVDSSEMAFKIAGSMAFKEAWAKPSPSSSSRSWRSRSSCPKSSWAT